MPKLPLSARFAAWIACLLLAVALALSMAACSKPPESVDVAYSPFESTALAWIADDQHFFLKNGLAVSFHKYDTGPAALDAALNGEAAIALGTGEFPLVSTVLHKKQPRVVATIARSQLVSVVARKDRGVENPADLMGKKVGTTRGTIAEFFLGRFLQIHDLTLQDVSVVDLKTPNEWVNAVAEGSVDAVVTAEPYATQAASALGENGVVWSAQSGQPLYALAISTSEWLKAHGDSMQRFLKSLGQAEEFAAANPEQAKAIVRARLQLEAGSMQAVWARNQFSLTLDQSLVAAMEDESRWLMTNGLTDATSMPDFLDYISADLLRAVRPEAVSIIQSGSQ